MVILHTTESSHVSADVYRGLYDASVGLLPLGAAAGDFWTANVAGVIDGVTVRIGDKIIASQAPTQRAQWSGEWVKIDVRDDVGPAIVDSDGATQVSVDLNTDDSNRISFITSSQLAQTLEPTGRMTLPRYATAADAATSVALYVAASGEVRQGPVAAAPPTSLSDRNGNTTITLDDGLTPDNDLITLTTRSVVAALFNDLGASISGELVMPAYPSTRNDGATTSALYVGAGGQVKRGPITNLHVPATVVDGATVDFTASGVDMQTVTAEITGVLAAPVGTAFVADGAGSAAWQAVALDQTTIFDGAATTRVSTTDQLNTVNITVLGVIQALFSSGAQQIGAAATDTTTIRGSVLVFPDIPQLDSSFRALYVDGGMSVKSGYLNTLSNPGKQVFIETSVGVPGEITLNTGGALRASVTNTGVKSAFDFEVTNAARGIVLTDSLGGRHRLTVLPDGSLQSTDI